jgi:hypothetical protein
MPRASKGPKGITRIDDDVKNVHGWYVRVYFNRKSQTRYFGDGPHGGKEKAFRKAVKCRDEIEKSLGKVRSDRIVVSQGARGVTGVAGVQRFVKGHRKSPDGATEPRVYYCVTWRSAANVIETKSFFVGKDGEAAAFNRAVALRKRMEKKIHGRVIQTRTPCFEEVLKRIGEQEKKKAVAPGKVRRG